MSFLIFTFSENFKVLPINNPAFKPKRTKDLTHPSLGYHFCLLLLLVLMVLLLELMPLGSTCLFNCYGRTEQMDTPYSKVCSKI